MRKEQIITTTNNNQMEEKGMKQRFIHFKRKFVPALSGAIMGVMLMSTTCFAAGGTSAVTQPAVLQPFRRQGFHHEFQIVSGRAV